MHIYLIYTYSRSILILQATPSTHARFMFFLTHTHTHTQLSLSPLYAPSSGTSPTLPQFSRAHSSPLNLNSEVPPDKVRLSLVAERACAVAGRACATDTSQCHRRVSCVRVTSTPSDHPTLDLSAPPPPPPPPPCALQVATEHSSSHYHTFSGPLSPTHPPVPRPPPTLLAPPPFPPSVSFPGIPWGYQFCVTCAFLFCFRVKR